MEDPFYAVVTRLVLLAFYLLAIIMSGVIARVGPQYHQTFIFSTLLFMYIIILTQDVNGNMYYLFFSNVFSTLIYIVFIVSGLRFTNALILGGLSIVIYITYCFLWFPNNYHIDQFPNVIINCVIATMAGYILEKSSRKAFFNDYLLKKKNEEYESYNILKNKLLSVISHDVQSPLNNINAILKMSEENSVLTEDATRLFQKIQKQIMDTISYVQKILYWTKNQMDGFQVERHAVVLRNAINHCNDGLDQIAKEKNIIIENHVENEISIHVDSEMLDIVLRNLVSNAIKFSPENSTIKFSFQQKGEWDEIAIMDQGVGIDKNRIETLFSFNHEYTKGTKLERGSGIGLSLCSEFMSKLNGHLAVESELGKGSTFFLRFKRTT